MTFAEPGLLYALLGLPVAALFFGWVARRRRAVMSRLGDPALIDRLSSAVNWQGRRLQTILWFTAVALAVVALSRPQWGSEVQVVERQGVQIVVALDVSKSMLAEDVKPDRLSRTKLEIVDLMGQLKGDELGVVLFSGAAFLQFPLTFDYSTAHTFLDEAGPRMITRPGTAIGEAIDVALAAFNQQRASQKVIIIMTDGEGHEGDPVAAAQRALEQDIVIYTVGFGTPEGVPIPEYGDDGEVTYKRDSNDEVVLSKLDEVTLQLIARETGGKYYRARGDGSSVDELATELDGLQKESVQSEFQTRNVERFQLFLAQIHRRDDYAAAERAIGAREGDGPGTIWGRGGPVFVFSCRGETL